MIHGPCGDLNPQSASMEDGKCKKKFPKPLHQQTECSVNGYPLYRRRGQHRAQLRNHTVNDSWVVPHNPQLLMKFNCHMNVEICTTIKSVKYIFKYIHKGNDAAHIEIRQHYLIHDEILQHLNARYVGPHQAVFRIMQYNMHDKSHIIIRLQFIYHLNKQYLFVQVKRKELFKLAKKPHSQLFSNSMKRMNMHMNTSIMKFLSITHSLYRKYGGKDIDFVVQLLVEFTKFNHLSQKDLHFAYSFFIEKELHRLTTSEQLMVTCMIHSKMQQEQWDCLRMTLSTGTVCKKHQS